MAEIATAPVYPSLKQNLEVTRDGFSKNVSTCNTQAVERRRTVADMLAHSLDIGDAKAVETLLAEWKESKLAMEWLKSADALIKSYPKFGSDKPTPKPSTHQAEPVVTIEKTK